MATSWASKAVGPHSGLWRKIISWLALHLPASIEFMPFLFSYLPHVENQVLWTQLMFGIGLAFSLSIMQSHSQLPCNVNPGWGFPRLPPHSWKVKQIWTLNTQLKRPLWQRICTKGLWTGDEGKTLLKTSRPGNKYERTKRRRSENPISELESEIAPNTIELSNWRYCGTVLVYWHLLVEIFHDTKNGFSSRKCVCLYFLKLILSFVRAWCRKISSLMILYEQTGTGNGPGKGKSSASKVPGGYVPSLKLT